jgi:hypothetical protein
MKYRLVASQIQRDKAYWRRKNEQIRKALGRKIAKKKPIAF